MVRSIVMPSTGLATAAPSTERFWLADSTFWWGLGAVGLVDRVVDLAGGRLRVTPAICEELTRRVDERPFLRSALECISAGRVETFELTVEELGRVADLRTLWQISPRDSKHLGEAELIAVAATRRLRTIIDDRQARFHFEYYHRDLDCIDTPHVLLGLVDGGVLTMDEAWTLLCRMRAEGDFDHAFAERPKADWMNRKLYPRVIAL